MLKGQAVNMLLNFFFGPIINAARGIAYQVGNAVTSFSSNITVAFKPQVVSSYSKGDTDRVTYLFTLQSKICFALIAILMIPIVLDIDEILRVWLGNDVPAYTSIFSIIVLIDALICSLNTPCTQVVSATGNIRNFQIASTCVNILLLPVCWLFLYLGFNPITVFVLTAVFSILNQIVCVWQTSRVFNISIPSYCTCVILPCLIFAFLCPIPGYICSLFIDAFILRLSVVVCLTCLWGITLTMLLFLSKSERAQLVFRLKSKFKCTK
jgi:O-antigen/teichoic acid export membrane protein